MLAKKHQKPGAILRTHRQTNRRIPPPLFPDKLHFSLTPDQVAALEDCLFFTASEAHPAPFRRKALDLIKLIRKNGRYSELVFEREKGGGDYECE